MNASLVSHTSTLHRRFKKHIINAVLGPMSIMRECNNAQIFADPNGVKIAVDLINEAYIVAKYTLRGLEPHTVFGWIE